MWEAEKYSGFANFVRMFLAFSNSGDFYKSVHKFLAQFFNSFSSYPMTSLNSGGQAGEIFLILFTRYVTDDPSMLELNSIKPNSTRESSRIYWAM